MVAIDLNHANASQRQLAEELNAFIDAGLLDDQSTPRRYLGASALGAACERAIQLDYIKANELEGAPEPASTFTGTTLRIFAIGHALEALAAGWLRLAGFDLSTHKPDGGQHGFSVADGRFSGHVDGVILSAPIDMATPALWEHKALGRKSWGEVVKRGVVAAKPVYAAQMALYQAYLDLQVPALFTATNRDTAEIYHELVPFDPALAQSSSDRAVKILQTTDAGELLPKGFAAAEHYECKMCRWRNFCWP